MALNIELMKQKLANSQNKNAGSSNDTKWRPLEGDQPIGILPTKDGDPFKEFHFHYNVGKNLVSLYYKKNYGEQLISFVIWFSSSGVTEREQR